MKKVMIITYNMIPYTKNWGASQRMYYLAKYLHKKHYKVFVISDKKSNLNIEDKGIDFVNIQLESKLTSNDVNIANNNTNNKITSFMKKIMKNLLRIIYFDPTGNILSFESYKFVQKQRNTIFKIITDENINTIIISGPPFGMFTIIPKLKKQFDNIKIIVDYRDPWNLWSAKRNALLSKIIEKKILITSNAIVVTNNSLLNDMANKYNISHKKFHVVQNGYSNNKIIHEKLNYRENYLNQKKFVFTYIGDINFGNNDNYRDTTHLISAFRDIVQEYPHTILKIIGVKNFESPIVFSLKKEFQNNIDIRGFIDPKEAYLDLLKSDVLILLHTAVDGSAKYIISGKMYEYIYSQKPIFSIGPRTSLHSEMVRGYELGSHCENNDKEIFSVLKRFIKGEISYKGLDSVNLNEFSRNYQNSIYLNLIDRMMNK